ncbi:MAG: hypothetical protein ABFD54_05075 [Armatimonadota bacterium]|nr:hypothetical protein [bacterium]
MERLIRVLVVTGLVAVCALVIVQAAALAAVFTEDFNRADSSTIGNGWTVTSSGNSAGGTAPVAKISGGRLLMDRAGWGSSAYCDVMHTIDATNSVEADLYAPGISGGGAGVQLSAIAPNNGYALFRLYTNDDGRTMLGVNVIPGGGWDEWDFYNEFLGYLSGPVRCKIETDGSANVTFTIIYNGQVIWSRAIAASVPQFTKVDLGAAWESWANGEMMIVDNVNLSVTPTAPVITFSDDFDRADTAVKTDNSKGVYFTSDIGNGWQERDSGNSDSEAIALQAPDAHMVGNRVEFRRNGWGPNGSSEILHTFNASNTVSARLSAPNDSSINLWAYDPSGAFIMLMINRTSNTSVGMLVNNNATPGWDGVWDINGDSGVNLGNIGDATYTISTDNNGLCTIKVEVNGRVRWSGSITTNHTSFTSAEISADWRSWGAGGILYADNLNFTPTPTAVFSDDFNRANTPVTTTNPKDTWFTSDILNGWQEKNGGNSDSEAIALRAPDAHLVDGQVEFNRVGWGPNAYSDITQVFSSPVTMAQIDMSIPPTAASGVSLKLDCSNTGFVMVRLWRDTNGIAIAVAALPTPGWNDWNIIGNLGNVSDPQTIKISTDGTNGVTVSAEQNGIIQWVGYVAGVYPQFTAATIEGSWMEWGDSGLVYADNLSAVSMFPTIQVINNLDDARKAEIGSAVSINDMIVSSRYLDDSSHTFCFAAEKENRSAAIRVISNTPVNLGDRVAIAGNTALVDGEFVINASTVSGTPSGITINPVAMNNKSTGGGAYGNQDAVYDDADAGVLSTGANTIGLYTTIYGKVTQAVDDFPKYSTTYFYVDDGSGLKDGSGYTGIKCYAPTDWGYYWIPANNDYVKVTGVMGVRQINGKNIRFFWTYSWDYISTPPAS